MAEKQRSGKTKGKAKPKAVATPSERKKQAIKDSKNSKK